jgi:hypothetical protein
MRTLIDRATRQNRRSRRAFRCMSTLGTRVNPHRG